MLQQIIGLLGGGGQPGQAAPQRVQADPKPEAPAAMSAIAPNAEHPTNAVAMAAAKAAKPDVPSTEIATNNEAVKPDAQQSMMLKVLEGALKPFGFDQDKLLKLLLSLNPVKAQEALLEAAQSLFVAKQATPDALAPQ